MQIFSSTQPDLNAARRVYDILLEHQHVDVLLLLSGGSAFSILEHMDTTILSERVTITVLDERYTFDDAASNFSQLTKTAFFERARAQHVRLIDPRPSEGEDLLDASRRFDLALKEWHITHHDGVVIATMGIGVDGHTAGILPFLHNPETFKELFEDSQRCVRGYHIDPRVNPHTDRITVTNTYLTRHVHQAVVYAAGEEKRPALQALQQESGEIHITPARIVRAMKEVQVYTDLTHS